MKTITLTLTEAKNALSHLPWCYPICDHIKQKIEEAESTNTPTPEMLLEEAKKTAAFWEATWASGIKEREYLEEKLAIRQRENDYWKQEYQKERVQREDLAKELALEKSNHANTRQHWTFCAAECLRERVQREDLAKELALEKSSHAQTWRHLNESRNMVAGLESTRDAESPVEIRTDGVVTIRTLDGRLRQI